MTTPIDTSLSSPPPLSSPTSSSTKTALLIDRLDAFFKLQERGTTIGTEFRAGTASFLTLSYLLLVNPQIMVQAGVDHDDAVFATALSASISCLLIGVLANLPFGCAPGLGLSAYLAFGLVQADLCDLPDALSICWWSGIFVLLISLSGLSALLMKVVPHAIKLAIVVGMGLLIAMIGMVSIDLIVANPKTLVELGDIWGNQSLQLSCAGLLLVASLLYHNVKGAVLIGIVVLTLCEWTMNSNWPKQVFQVPAVHDNGYFKPEILWDLDQAGVVVPALFSFVLICIFDISGVLFGLATLGDLMTTSTTTNKENDDDDDDENGNENNNGEKDTIPGSMWAFVASGIGTLVAAWLGSTPIIVCVECASGVKEGGRTGLTAVFMSMYFALSIFLAPFFSSVPELATAPVLVLVGVMMMGESAKIDWENMQDALPAFLTIILMPLTYSITNGMIFGLLAAIGFYFTSGQFFQHMEEVQQGSCRGSSIKDPSSSPLEENGIAGGEEAVPMIEKGVNPTPKNGHGNATKLDYGTV